VLVAATTPDLIESGADGLKSRAPCRDGSSVSAAERGEGNTAIVSCCVRAEDSVFPRFCSSQRGVGRRVLISGCYGAGVPDIAPPISCSQTLPVVTVGGPAKKSARFCWTQPAARAVDSSAPA
jgi:hypothetical protein